MSNHSVLSVTDTHNPFIRKAVAMRDEIICAASRAIENHNDRELDILVELSDHHSDDVNREFEKICRIEYVGLLTEEDQSNVMYMWARSEAAKRRFDNPELDYRGVLDNPGMKKLSVEIRKLKTLQPLRDFVDNYATLISSLSCEQDHQGFRDTPNLVEEAFHHDDVNDIVNERRDLLGSNSAQHRHKTKRFAKEPEVYARQVKKCPRCFSVNAKFKYLNNKKMEQPRYLCLSCNNQFTHGGKVAPARVDSSTTTCLGDITVGFSGGDGVTGTTMRKRKAREPQKFVGLKKECPNCHSEDAEFKYLNNKKEDQPRYKCLQCKQLYQFLPKRTRLINAEKIDSPLHVPVCELPERGSSVSPSADIKGNDIVTESSTLHLQQNQQPLNLEGSRS